MQHQTINENLLIVFIILKTNIYIHSIIFTVVFISVDLRSSSCFKLQFLRRWRVVSYCKQNVPIFYSHRCTSKEDNTFAGQLFKVRFPPPIDLD